jgi:hypothetical protein
MCAQALLDASQPSACYLVPFFKSASAIYSLHAAVAVRNITEQNMRINILESSGLAKPEELIVDNAVLDSV